MSYMVGSWKKACLKHKYIISKRNYNNVINFTEFNFDLDDPIFSIENAYKMELVNLVCSDSITYV